MLTGLGTEIDDGADIDCMKTAPAVWLMYCSSEENDVPRGIVVLIYCMYPRRAACCAIEQPQFRVAECSGLLVIESETISNS